MRNVQVLLLLLLLINRMVLLLLLMGMQMLLMLRLEMLLLGLLRRLIIHAIWERIYSVGAESIYIGLERELIEEGLHRIDWRVVNRLTCRSGSCIV